MIKHISLFKFKGAGANGKTKEENIQTIKQMLEDLPSKAPFVLSSEVGVIAGEAPPLPPDAPIIFADLAQILTFANAEDAGKYGPCEAHGALAQIADPMLDKIVAIDFEL